MKKLFGNLIYMRLIEDIGKNMIHLKCYLIFYFLIQSIPIFSIIYVQIAYKLNLRNFTNVSRTIITLKYAI